VPSAIPRLDKTICTGDGGIAKNFGMVNRINSVQAAGYHIPAAISAVAMLGCKRRSGAENAQSSSKGKIDEGFVCDHGDLPLVGEAVVPRLCRWFGHSRTTPDETLGGNARLAGPNDMVIRDSCANA
jgi:hypothetical protein